MRSFSRRAAAPEQGWFQIGEVTQQTAPRRRGQGRVSISVSQQQDPDTASLQPQAPNHTPVLARANGAAAKALLRIIDRRYGALALCGAALLLVVIVAAVIALSRTGTASAAVTSQHSATQQLPRQEKGPGSVHRRA